MNTTLQNQTQALIDRLKSICANAGLGNDAGEYKIITQVFLYKFLNDKFIYELKKAFKKANPNVKDLDSKHVYSKLETMSKESYEELLDDIGANVKFEVDELIPSLISKQNETNFYVSVDSVFENIANRNIDIFSIQTEGGAKIKLFEPIMHYIIDQSKRDHFAKAIISSLTTFDFEQSFSQGYDFFAHIFEYLIKDYNKDNGGKYAEYYTPLSISEIMSKILIAKDSPKSVSCYDPSAGSGTLLMSLAHTIGQDKCSIYAQDISQKSSQLLRLNLILNNLSHSIHNITQGNTLTHPNHSNKAFDYIVSNPPFNLDFSEYRDMLAKQEERFFAGVPKIPPKNKEEMGIYLCFFQHLLNSLSPTGKAAIVVPTGFVTAQKGIAKDIRKYLIDHKALMGAVIMPKDIFATTGTNVSVIFIDKGAKRDYAYLCDASKLGSQVKIDNKKRTILSEDEQELITTCFINNEVKEDFSILVSLEDIKVKGYSFAAGYYFEFKDTHIELSQEAFEAELSASEQELQALFTQSEQLQKQILENFAKLKFKG